MDRQPIGHIRYFNPPSPCGEGLLYLVDSLDHCRISIHPPRVGRDLSHFVTISAFYPFQSTLPVWGGTPIGFPLLAACINFNPPSPCGEGRRT